MQYEENKGTDKFPAMGCETILEMSDRPVNGVKELKVKSVGKQFGRQEYTEEGSNRQSKAVSEVVKRKMRSRKTSKKSEFS